MEFSKSASLIDISTKPRNTFTMEALKKVVEHKGKVGTMAFFKTPTTMIDFKHLKIAKSIDVIKQERITEEKKEIGIEKIPEAAEDLEQDKKKKRFIIEDDSDSDSDSSGGSYDGVAEQDLEHKKEMEDLVDDELTSLLLQFDTLPRPTQADIDAREQFFGEPKRQKTLILDMDETLIHAKLKSTVPADYGEDFCIECVDGDDRMVFAVKKRPNLEESLERLSQFYELCVFTAAERNYAEQIVDRFDPGRQWISHLLTREQCFDSNGFLVKELNVIKDRRIEDMVIVDNSIVCFAFNLDNGIPISPYMGDNELDEELIFMASYLEDIYSFPDLRKANISNFNLSKIQLEARKAKVG